MRDVNGVKTPWYQSQQSKYDPSVIHPCDPGSEWVELPEYKNATCTFGSKRPSEMPTLERPVPEEFRDVAIAASEQRWGEIETIDDGYVSYMKSLGQDPTKAFKKQNAPEPAPAPTGSVVAQPLVFAPPNAIFRQNAAPADPPTSKVPADSSLASTNMLALPISKAHP